MRTRWMVVIAVCALMALTQVASAQQRRGRGFGRGGMMTGPLNLLQNESVQKELNLTDEQKDKIKEAAQPVQEKARAAFQGLRDLSPDERRTKMEELQKEMASANEAAMKSLKGVLKPEQEKRLHQIELQAQVQMGGPRAFENPKLADRLQLTDDQKNSIKTIVSDQNKELEGLERGERFQKQRELNKEGVEKVMGILTDKQKTEWKEMTGSPFQLQFPRGGRRGRRGGNGGNPPPA